MNIDTGTQTLQVNWQWLSTVNTDLGRSSALWCFRKRHSYRPSHWKAIMFVPESLRQGKLRHSESRVPQRPRLRRMQNTQGEHAAMVVVSVCVRLHVCIPIVSLHMKIWERFVSSWKISISNGFPIVYLFCPWMAEVLHHPGIWLSHSFFVFFVKGLIHLKWSGISFINSILRDFFCGCLGFKIPLNFWPNKGILKNDCYIPETPTLESKWSFKFWPSAFTVLWNFKFISCCSWVRDFPAAEYPAAGWTEFTPFAYQPRKKLSRRVWEEAIEGPTGQVVDFWLVMFWLVMI